MEDYEREVDLSREAHAKFSAGDYRKAIELYEASVNAAPSAKAFRGLGECYSATGQHQTAILYFAASAGLRPFPKASLQLAQSLFACGYNNEAKRATERAIAAMPHFRSAHALLDEINSRIAEERAKNPNDSATH